MPFGRIGPVERKKLLGQLVDPKTASISIELLLPEAVHSQLLAYSKESSLPFGEAALFLIQRGMENYWLMYYSFLRREYFLLRERHDKYKRDNELFKALEKQNARLSACLAGQEACQEVRGGEDIQ